MAGLFYNLGRKVGPQLRKAKWMWDSAVGTESDAIRTEKAVGLDLAREVRLQLDPDEDRSTQQFLRKIGAKLTSCVGNRLRTFSFESVNTRETNAFALPGGFIFVTVPLLDLCHRSRDEIAFVLGHEMAHVIKGHAIERVVTNSAFSAVAKAPAGRGLAAWLRTVGLQLLQSAYSQDQELDADLLGVRLSQAAGFDPDAAVDALTRLAETKNTHEGLDLGAYFSTHPPFDMRIRNIKRFLLAQA